MVIYPFSLQFLWLCQCIAHGPAGPLLSSSVRFNIIKSTFAFRFGDASISRHVPAHLICILSELLPTNTSFTHNISLLFLQTHLLECYLHYLQDAVVHYTDSPPTILHKRYCLFQNFYFKICNLCPVINLKRYYILDTLINQSLYFASRGIHLHISQ